MSMNKMNIAMFCMGSHGGSTEVAIDIAVSMKKRGHDCTIYAYEDGHRDRLTEAGIRLRTPQSLDYPLFQSIKTDFGFLVAFEKDHKQKPFDLIHVHYAVPLAHVMSNLHDIYGLPCILTFHGSDVTIIPDIMNVSMISGLIRSSTKHLTVASRFLERKARDVYGLACKDIRLIPNTVSDEFFEEYEAEAMERPYFLHCSNLRPVKRVWDIVLAMCCIKKRHEYADLPVMPQLKVAGDGPDMHELRLLVRNNKLEDDVIFCGHIESRRELAQLMRSAKALVLASFTESQPLVILESMAVGTPVICSNFESAEELVGTNGERGWTFDIGDSHDMADVMIRLLKEPEKAEAASKRARGYMLENHQSSKVMQTYCSLYGEALGIECPQA
ncbi:MAG: glycosyltransferase family 4 protein [Candidatus Sumerlaeia bacterium]